jgi:hypothetical protein
MSSVTNTGKMFTGSTVFIQYIVFWDVSNVTNVNSVFENATFFNNDIASWDVSRVTHGPHRFPMHVPSTKPLVLEMCET